MSAEKGGRLDRIVVAGEVVWFLLMLFKLLTAVLVLAADMFTGMAAEMPTPQQVWFAMLVVFLLAADLSQRKLRAYRQGGRS